uniref:Non-LTR retroelement reverse transcriptase n=1 Tax=Solanum tuberosum TaxID=4113 RepID=M0ZKV5_SOLTU
MTEFSECIEELELVDPPLFGGSYTWRRGEGHQTASRIDRFLYSSQWEEQFTFIKQSTMPKLGSDHNPILLTCGNLNFKKSYFKFENWWMRVEGFKEEVKLWWQSFVITGTPGFVLAEKLKLLKGKMKEWSKNNRKNCKAQKEEIMEELAKWEAVQEQRVLTEEEIQQKTNLASTYEQVAKNEEIRWRQRSRIQWLKQRDKNTKFFHRVATSQKRYNSIESLLVDGCNTNDPSVIKETIKSFYQNLYTEPEEWRPELQLQGITTISVEEQIELEGPFEEEEILGCLKLYAMEKAPGPDGFPCPFTCLSGDPKREYYKGYTRIPG